MSATWCKLFWGTWWLPMAWCWFLPKPPKCPDYGQPQLNSLALESCGSNFRSWIFRYIIQSSSFGNRREIALMWMPQNLPYEKSTLGQAMAWCRQATSHYLTQIYGATNEFRDTLLPANYLANHPASGKRCFNIKCHAKMSFLMNHYLLGIATTTTYG